MNKRLLTLIDFSKPKNHPATAGWVEIFTGCYMGWTMLYTAFGLAKLKLPSWTLLMPLSMMIILSIVVLVTTRKRLIWAYYASIALLVQPSVKFIRTLIHAPQSAWDNLGLPLVGTLLFSLAALIVLAMPATLNWVKSRPNPKFRKCEYYAFKDFVPVKIELDGLDHRFAAFAVNPDTSELERNDYYI